MVVLGVGGVCFVVVVCVCMLSSRLSSRERERGERDG